MNTKHTPAPWLLNVKNKFCNGNFLFITDINDKVICKVSHDLTEVHIDEYLSNAKLISAAPELLEEEFKNLEFLKWVATKAREFNMWSDKVQELNERISKTESAIKKAASE